MENAKLAYGPFGVFLASRFANKRDREEEDSRFEDDGELSPGMVLPYFTLFAANGLKQPKFGKLDFVTAHFINKLLSRKKEK